jgi:hypothetical protein
MAGIALGENPEAILLLAASRNQREARPAPP